MRDFLIENQFLLESGILLAGGVFVAYVFAQRDLTKATLRERLADLVQKDPWTGRRFNVLGERISRFVRPEPWVPRTWRPARRVR